MILKCPRCEYIWDYGGKLLQANCPVCHYTLSPIIKHTATVEEYRQQLRDEYRQKCARAGE